MSVFVILAQRIDCGNHNNVLTRFFFPACCRMFSRERFTGESGLKVGLIQLKLRWMFPSFVSFIVQALTFK